MAPNANTDRRIARSKRALRTALIELMEERGLDGLSVNDLCARADLNRGTFYNHFHDKDDLLTTLEDEVIADLERIQEQMKDLTVMDLVRYRTRKQPLPFLVDLFDYLREQGDFLHAVTGPGGDIRFAPRLRDTNAIATTPRRSSSTTWRFTRRRIWASSSVGSRRACRRARRRWR